MTTTSSIKSLRSESGQVLPLACVSLLATALMVFLSLNISYTVRNRIRLQNYVDAKAYSTAVQEARAFNYYAYSNRAIANAFVEAATLHAYMSEAAMMSSIDWGMFEGFEEISGCEFAKAAAEFAEWDVGDGIEDTIHGIEAQINAIFYMIDYFDGDMSGKIQKLDSPMMTAMNTGITGELTALRGSQQLMNISMTLWLVLDSGVDEVKKNNLQDPNAGSGVSTVNSMVLGAINMSKYNNAIDTSNSNKQKRAEEMTAVVNATRPPFTWDRNSAIGTTATAMEVLMPMLMPGGPLEKEAEIDSGSFWGPVLVTQTPPNIVNIMSAGRSAMSDGAFGINVGIFQEDASSTAQGKSIVSEDSGGAVAFGWHCCPGATTVPSFILPSPIAAGYIESNSSGGNHYGDEIVGFDLGFLSSPHSGNNHKFDPKADSFIDYNINDSASGNTPFNQPVVYAYGSADMRQNDRGNSNNPWEIKDTGVQVNVDGTGQGDGKLVLGDNRGKARAIAKAQVYYHRFGDWRDPPNFFNPYWRAKMDSFNDTSEMTQTVILGEITDGLDIQQMLSMEMLTIVGNGALNTK